jgi:hypothetical protein
MKINIPDELAEKMALFLDIGKCNPLHIKQYFHNYYRSALNLIYEDALIR